MEPEGDESSHHTQISRKDSVLAIPLLPQELITSILVRLPVKYLLQFKCVSKDWFALISSPHFVNTHLTFSAKDFTRYRLLLEMETYSLRHCSVSSLFYDSVTDSFKLEYPIKGPKGIFGIVGSVNGLICYCIEFNDFVLWNPSTRKFKKVPDVMPTETVRYCFTCGFGYDEVHDDYKVVAVFRDIHVRIYSLKSDSWRALDDFQGEIAYNSMSKFVNGRLHWVTYVDDGRGIMSIDLVDEKWRKVELPCFGVEDYFLTLGGLGTDFYVLCSHEERTDVWVMKEYGVKESWTKLYTVKCSLCEPSAPLCMSTEGEILHVVDTNLTIYNPEDDSMRYPEVTNAYENLAELYIESLVSPVLQKRTNDTTLKAVKTQVAVLNHV